MNNALFGVSMILAVAAFGDTPSRIEIAPSKAGVSDRTGDVVLIMADGTRERLTQSEHCSDPKLGPSGLVGWTWASENNHGSWVNSHLRVQFGKRVVIDVQCAKPFIEEWGFSAQGVVAKSRSLHGPATIELFSLDDGHRVGSVDAFADDLPSWAAPFTD